jgi:lincosamide nucleotidyltransferase A/C/D/E
VLEILEVLDSSEIPYLVAGGWGVDALLGRQTRRHRDLDLVLPAFEVDEPRALRALSALGYKRQSQRPAGIWMPIQSLVVDGAGHQIELLSIDLERIGESLAQEHGPRGDAPDSSHVEVAGTGEIDGHRVACLSLEVQLLAHSGYEARASDRRDLQELLELRDLLTEESSQADQMNDQES